MNTARAPTENVGMAIHRVTPEEAPRVRGDLSFLARDVRRSFVQLGDTGDEVRAVQRLLADVGFYAGPVDGRFQSVTDDAVRRFQRATNIVVDGAVGPQTLGELRERQRFVGDHFSTPARRGEIGDDVRAIEAKLARAGLNPGRVDGLFDRRTEEAVRRFRASSPTLPDRPAVIDGALERELNARLQNANTRPPQSGPRPGTLEYFDRNAPTAGYRRVQRSGVTINARTNEMLDRAQRIMREKYGHRNFQFQLSQGSYNPGGVGASAGTHDGGGAIDVRTVMHGRGVVDDMVRSLREAGFAAWSRGRGHDSFDPHIHAIAIGDRELSSVARAQVVDYAAGRNGLANDARDPDRHLGRNPPRWASRYL
ncbi:peptidoglycan-binding protein [Myxococcota bacterium]|nr:peptidoglycan-binding protein [Myxococcota bacterium]